MLFCIYFGKFRCQAIGIYRDKAYCQIFHSNYSKEFHNNVSTTIPLWSPGYEAAQKGRQISKNSKHLKIVTYTHISSPIYLQNKQKKYDAKFGQCCNCD